MQLSPNSPNWKLIQQYLRLRQVEDRITRKKKDVQDILRFKLKAGRGRMMSKSGSALLRQITRRHYSPEIIDRLVVLGLLPKDEVAKAYSESHIERVEVNAIPD